MSSGVPSEVRVARRLPHASEILRSVPEMEHPCPKRKVLSQIDNHSFFDQHYHEVAIAGHLW